MENKEEDSSTDKNNVHKSTDTNEASFKTPDDIAFKTPIPSQPPKTLSKPKSTQDAAKTDGPDIVKKEPTEVTEKNKRTNLSPAEQLKQSQVVVPYKEPPWGGLTEEEYSFEIVKNGSIVGTVELNGKSFYIFGRLPSCDVQMDHPSLSRYHAVVQYCATPTGEYEKGWYLYDLDSTHGTWINKYKIKPNVYQRLRVGHVLKFGGSTRLHILQGPDDDQEEESELTASELKQQRERQKKETEVLRQAELAEEERKLQIQKQREEDTGCSWGIDNEDAVEEDEDEENPTEIALSTENESLYMDDPKKALKGFFEREGYDPPEYEFSDAGQGKRRCFVELPVDSPTGEPMVAEIVVSGKKKDAVVACALEACRILDRMGLLRAAKHESRKKKKKNWEEDDFYDSDEDIYLDRTGTIEKKRQMRMKQSKKNESAVETFDSLVEKHTAIVKEIADIQAKLDKAKADAAAYESEDMDALDAYMSAIKSGVMDTKTKMKLKRELMELKQEELKLSRLMKIAQPASLPPVLSSVQGHPSKVPHAGHMPSVGKMKGFDHAKTVRKPAPKLPTNTNKMPSNKEDFVEEEEDEDEEETTSTDLKSTIGETKPTTEPSVTFKPNEFTKVTAKSTSIFTDKIHLPSTDSNVTGQVDSKSSRQEYAKIDKSVDSSKGSSKKMFKGPTMPLAAVLERLQAEEEGDSEETLEENNTWKENRKRSSQFDDNKGTGKKSQKLRKGQEGKLGGYDSTDPDYATWVPPQNQSGDGTTHLNAKYGY